MQDQILLAVSTSGADAQKIGIARIIAKERQAGGVVVMM